EQVIIRIGLGRPRLKSLLQCCRQLRAIRLREVPVRIAHTPSSVIASRARLPTPLHRGVAPVAAPAFRSHGAESVAPTGCVYESYCTLRRLKRVAQTARRVLILPSAHSCRLWYDALAHAHTGITTDREETRWILSRSWIR